MINVAILDMYDGEPNQGMRCIKDIIGRFEQDLVFTVYDVRGKAELPKLEDHDLYISTGGPGDPLEGNGVWEVKNSIFLHELLEWNKTNIKKKHLLLICHSFQMAVHSFGLATLSKRKSTSFGVMSIHKTEAGYYDPLFENLGNPFWAIDSRDYQVTQPKHKKFKEMGAKIIALEKIRTHLEYERALMAIRFSPEIVGTQFHPEADPVSFMNHLRKEEIKQKIISRKGKAKYRTMLEHLMDEDKIYKTNETLIPNFLNNAINQIKEQALIFQQ
ncbi:GMP synthase [Belliella sp. DSM 107340]|uniref:GMP synthase n=1 Tax=Belliella calami TaxID=2923436 RepID=A0ABS9UKK5_9BACT|nr:GMP synthase [Belliella calami]MCH7397142.1 GMP synthase [Belliella calami]